MQDVLASQEAATRALANLALHEPVQAGAFACIPIPRSGAVALKLNRMHERVQLILAAEGVIERWIELLISPSAAVQVSAYSE
jgi:hypothetical protein